MPDEERQPKKVEAEVAADQQKTATESETESKNKPKPTYDSHTGLTRAFHKPISDETEDSLARKVEDIESQYNIFNKLKKMSVSGVTGSVGDLLASKPEVEKKEDSSLDDLFGSGKPQKSADDTDKE